MPSKDMISKDTVNKDMVSKVMLSKDMASKDTVSRDMVKVMLNKDTIKVASASNMGTRSRSEDTINSPRSTTTLFSLPKEMVM